ncbi:MAG: Kae1-associated serine/threonine protein kinase [Thaumarchaeota archaeon]|nr:Kae1-associated serine/threonine protein kinase [Nitrososphaerota archaeon]
MKLLKKGAEGDIFLITWNKKKAILKARKKKDYRNSLLDQRIRKQRTIRECEIISEVKSFGVSTPLIYNMDTKNCTIIMQHIAGTVVNDLSESKLIKSCIEIGKIVGVMHKNGIMHGDLTTSNFIVSKGKMFVLDFGLANKTNKPEDHAVDLRLLKEILNSAHTKIMNKAWSNFLKGYKSAVDSSRFSKITNLVKVIESRGRYANVT